MPGAGGLENWNVECVESGIGVVGLDVVETMGMRSLVMGMMMSCR